jgi:hypothetical protein
VLRRLGLIALCTGLTFALTPTSATANIIRWVDKLSGPGPFWGPQFEWRLVCVSGDPETTDGEKERVRKLQNDPSRRQAPITPSDYQPKAVIPAIGILGPCMFDRGPENGMRRVSINVGVGILWTHNTNDLKYESQLSKKDRTVNMTTLETTAMWRVRRGVDAGPGIGLAWFSGRQFDSFKRVALIPVRIDYRPFDAYLGCKDPGCGDSTKRRMLNLRFDLTVIPRGFDGKDFGAAPERFAPRDILPSVSFIIDLYPVARRLKNRGRWQDPTPPASESSPPRPPSSISERTPPE